MACPWKFLFRVKSYQGDLKEEKDINNNVEKTPGAIPSPTTQDDPKSHRPTKHQNGFPQFLTGTAQNVPESLDKLHVTPSTRPQHVRIKNWGNGEILHDTLHHKATSDISCKSKLCKGSIMYSKSLTRGPRDKPTPVEELLPQAIEFINQYYGSFKEAKIEEHLARLEAVTKEIETTGTYQLTLDELIFATKMAWRNAPRCIGRIQWSNLQVFDARSCSTATEWRGRKALSERT